MQDKFTKAPRKHLSEATASDLHFRKKALTPVAYPTARALNPENAGGFIELLESEERKKL